MASIMNLTVRHKATVRTIALYNGLASEELSTILQAIFSLSASAVVVGLLSAEVSDEIWLEILNKPKEIVKAKICLLSQMELFKANCTYSSTPKLKFK